MVRRLYPFLLLLSACDFGFKPDTLVDDLRLLSVEADPPVLRPGDSAVLKALVVDPKFPQPTTLWLGCAPDPFDENRSACADPALLQDPSQLGQLDALPPGVTFLGLGEQVLYGSDPHLFDVLAADDPRRQKGTVGPMVLITVADQVPIPPTQADLSALFQKVQSKEVQSLITLYRVQLSESAEVNHNPKLGRLSVAGERIPVGAHFQVVPHFQADVDLSSEDADYEPYTEVTPTGTQQLTEKLLVAWYATSGRFSHDRVALRSGVLSAFTAPGSGDKTDPKPDHPEQTLWAVVRDTRGGQVFGSFPFYVCDAALPQPVPKTVSSPATRADPVVLEGDHLENVLDVVADDFALEGGAFSASSGQWRGFLPAGLPAGTWAVKVFGKDGSRQDYPLTVTAP